MEEPQMSSATTMESVFRRSTFLTAVGICIAVVTLLAGVGGVRGQGGATFGIRPADESTGAYFSYTLEPGARISKPLASCLRWPW